MQLQLARAAALGFAELGARVVITGRRAAPLEAPATGHPNIMALVADAADPGDAGPAVAKAIESWGRLDVLVNNAGAGPAGRSRERRRGGADGLGGP